MSKVDDIPKADPEDVGVVDDDVTMDVDAAVDDDDTLVIDADDINDEGGDGVDSDGEDSEDGDSENEGGDGEDDGKSSIRNPAYNGLLPISLLAGLIGLILGPVLPILCALLFGKVFYPLFIVGPLLMYFFNSLLKGGRGLRALIVNAVFSLAGAYLAAAACQVALYTKFYNISAFQIPVITALVIGRSGVLPASASAYAYPLVFTALGVVISALLLRGRIEVLDTDEVDDEAEAEDESDEEVDNEVDDEADNEVDADEVDADEVENESGDESEEEVDGEVDADEVDADGVEDPSDDEGVADEE